MVENEPLELILFLAMVMGDWRCVFEAEMLPEVLFCDFFELNRRRISIFEVDWCCCRWEEPLFRKGPVAIIKIPLRLTGF